MSSVGDTDRVVGYATATARHSWPRP